MSELDCGQSRGYTLLELVLVLAILAIALAAVAPSLSAFAAGRKAEDAARQFAGPDPLGPQPGDH